MIRFKGGVSSLPNNWDFEYFPLGKLQRSFTEVFRIAIGADPCG